MRTKKATTLSLIAIWRKNATPFLADEADTILFLSSWYYEGRVSFFFLNEAVAL